MSPDGSGCVAEGAGGVGAPRKKGGDNRRSPRPGTAFLLILKQPFLYIPLHIFDASFIALLVALGSYSSAIVNAKGMHYSNMDTR